MFCTGGFTHNVELRKNYLSAPVYGGCAARTNEGDFVYIAGAVGAQLRNMNYAWMCPIVFEKAIAKDPALIGTFSPSGDSMIYVNKEGRRVANEKLAYNEMAQVFFQWDGARAEYPNLVLIAIWDQRSQDHSASDEYGRFIVPPGTDDAHVIKGATLAALQQGDRRTPGALQGRHRRFRHSQPTSKKRWRRRFSVSTDSPPAAGISTSSVASVRSNCCSTVR